MKLEFFMFDENKNFTVNSRQQKMFYIFKILIIGNIKIRKLLKKKLEIFLQKYHKKNKFYEKKIKKFEIFNV